MKLKEINITACTAWSPRHVMPIYLATATAAQQLDANFDSASQLKLYDLNTNESNLELKLVASKTVPSKFHQLLWKGDTTGILGQKSGVLVGACDDSSVYIYSADKLLKNADPLLLHLDGKHAGPVYTVDFNHHQKNLLASGSKNCEILIWDVNHPTSPMTPFTKPNLSVNVTSVAWNWQVENIMAATYSGCCIVYDLKKSASIVQIPESVSRLNSHGVCWHPSVATQMIIWSGDDHTPVAQLWDLRFAASPVSSMEGHERGIAAAQWCADDPDLFITCGKDNRVLIWNPNCAGKNGEIVGEFPAYNQWSFDVSWCGRDPSLVATSTIDASVSVYSLMGAGVPPNQTNKFSAIADSFPGMELPQETPQAVMVAPIQLKKPPKWFNSKCGASFGFGGKLVSWNQESKAVTVSQVITQQELVTSSQSMEEALALADLGNYCECRASEAMDKSDQDVWKFLEASFESNSRSSFFSLLGFDPNAIARKVRPESFALDSASVANKISELSLGKNTESSSSLDPSEQFEMIAASSSLTKTPEVLESDQDLTMENLCLKVGNDSFGMLRSALVVGDFESAVEICLEQRQSSLALILAAEAGGNIFFKTQQKVLRSESITGVSALVGGIVNRNFEDIAATCELGEWKAALVAVLTYTDDSELAQFSGILGERLEKSGKPDYLKAALLCYICAGNVDRFAGCFKKSRPGVDSSSNNSKPLHNLVEYLVLLQRALTSAGRSFVLEKNGHASRALSRYSSILASQGALNTALSYINNCSKEEMTVLQDRISIALRGSNRAASASRDPRSRSVSTSSQQPLRRTSTPHSHKQAQYQSATSFTPAARPPQPMHQPAFVAPSQPPPMQPVRPFANIQQPQQLYPAVPPTSQLPPVDGNIMKRSRYVSSVPAAAPEPVSQFSPAPPAMFTPSQDVSYSGHSNPVSNYGPPPMPQMPPSYAPPADPAYGSGTYDPGMVPPAAFDPSVPRGWNDPPAVSSIRRQKQTVNKAAATPQPLPSMMVPEAQQVPPSFSGYPQMGFGGQSMPRSATVEPMQRSQPPPPVAKQPIPAEHIDIHNVLDRLRHRGLQIAATPQAKQRLEDVGPKLELLYDKLRSGQISKRTTDGLHQVIDAVRAADYHQALLTHSATVSSGNFSEMASFMPALKTLLSTCMQSQIFLQ